MRPLVVSFPSPSLTTLRRASLFGSAAAALFLAACGGAEPPPPETAASAPAASGRGELEPSRVVFAMRGSEKDYRKCFFQAPQSRGSVHAALDIGANGAVERVSIESSSLDRPEVVSCLERRLAEQRFGEQAEATRAEWTFVFRLTDPIDADEFEKRLEAEEEKDPEPAIVVSPSSSGRLSADQIEETVHVHYPLFARCYRDSIRRREDAGGIVRFELVIDERGDVRDVRDAGSIMPDPFAVDCIAEGFYAMNFPRPSGGDVTAIYRLELD